LVGENGSLTHQIKKGILPSLILWDHLELVKTTLGHYNSPYQWRPFYTLSAISSGVKDIREVIEKAKAKWWIVHNQKPNSLYEGNFIALGQIAAKTHVLGAGKKVGFTLIWCTTENPSFEVNSSAPIQGQVIF